MLLNFRIFIAFFSFSIVSFSLAAQEFQPWNETDNLPRYLTPSELSRLHEIGEGFERTSQPQSGVRKIAEFERSSGVIIRYPLGIPMTLVRDLANDTKVIVLVANDSRRTQAINDFQSGGVSINKCEFVIAPTNSMWTRDYGPWFVATADDQVAVMDFIYNRPRASDNNVPNVIAQYFGLERYGLPLVHCGGNFMADGWFSGASTDLVIEENTGGLERVLKSSYDFLGIDQYIITEDAQGEYIKHIDTWAKFLDVDKILIARVATNHPRYSIYEGIAQYYSQQICAYGYPYKVYRVDSPNGQPYTNSLIVNDKVYVPITGSSWDNQALEVYREAMPGYEVTGYQGSWISTDALHCRVKEMADPQMLYIRHMPRPESISYTEMLQMDVEVVPYSGAQLVGDSTLLIYSRSGIHWDTISLFTNDNRHFEAQVPIVLGDTALQYYIVGRDMVGNSNNWPLVGKNGPRRIQFQYSQDLKAVPESIVLSHPSELLDPIHIRIENNSDLVGVVTLQYPIDTADNWWSWTAGTVDPVAVQPQGALELSILINPELYQEPSIDLSDTIYLQTLYGELTIPIHLQWSTTSSTELSHIHQPLSIYPNPTFDQIQITHPSFSLNTVGRIELLDVLGNLVYSSQQGSASAAGIYTLSVDTLPAGSYFVRYFLRNGIYTGRFVKQ